MKMYKIIFFNSMILGTLISISSYSWFSMWMGLEINLLSIIPLFNNSKNIFSSESSLKYFISQTMASMILLMTVILMLLTNEFINPLMNHYFLMMLNSSLFLKLGAAPFHFWFPEVIEGLNWENSFILLTWQKIAPSILIMNNKINFSFFIFIIISCLLISIMNMNQISLRKIMAFSSINHLAWMISTMMISFSNWMIYFSIYSIINLNLILMFYYTNCFYIKQMNNIFNINKLFKISLMLNFLSLGGLPPFIGFFPKWMTINFLILKNLSMLALILIILTLIMLFIYIRIMLSFLTMNTTEPKIFNFNKKKYLFISMNFLTLSSLIFCTLIFNFY